MRLQVLDLAVAMSRAMTQIEWPFVILGAPILDCVSERRLERVLFMS